MADTGNTNSGTGMTPDQDFEARKAFFKAAADKNKKKRKTPLDSTDEPEDNDDKADPPTPIAGSY